MTEDSPTSVRRWRLTIGCFVIAFGLHVLWACNYGKLVGIGGGFARADDLVDIKAQLANAASTSTDVQLKLLRKSIIDTRIQQCNAKSKLFFTQHLEELLDEYDAIVKVPYKVPACEDLK